MVSLAGSRLWATVLCPIAMFGAACSQAPPEGHTPLAEAAKGSEAISSRHFGRQVVPCDDPEATARALLEITERDLGGGTRTRLLDHAVDDIRLRDGGGKIAVIVYAVSSGEDSDELTTTEHFLINDDCRILPWSSAARPGENHPASEAG